MTLFMEIQHVLQKYPFLENCSYEQKEVHLLYGHIQSGKTEALLSTCLVTQRTGIPTVFLIPNLSNGWYGQLQPRISQFNKRYANPIHPIYVGEHTSEELKSKIVKQPSCVLVCLANYSQLSRCVEVLENQPLHLVMDEADQMYKDEQTVFSPLFQLLLTSSRMIFIVSATTFKLWFEAELYTKMTHSLPIPANYKGINKFDFQWTNRNKQKYVPIGNGPIHEADSSFRLWINELLELESFPYEKAGETYFHPVIGLYKATDEIKLHSHIQQEIRKEFQTITTFTYDSKGILLYSPELQDTWIQVKRERCRIKNGKYLLEDTSVSELLQYLKDNGGVARFPVIIIISGRLANRMFSFVSEDYEWHLTHQRLYMSMAADCTTLLQSVRLCGIYQDDIPLTLSCDMELYHSLKKAFELQNQMIDQLHNEERAISVEEFVKEGHVEKSQIPKRKLVAGQSYNKQIGIHSKRSMGEESEEERGLETLFRMITEKKRDADAPAYLRILRCFDEQKEEALDREWISREAKLANFSHYTQWNLSRHNQYQLLVQHGTKYIINPKVKKWWEHNK